MDKLGKQSSANGKNPIILVKSMEAKIQLSPIMKDETLYNLDETDCIGLSKKIKIVVSKLSEQCRIYIQNFIPLFSKKKVQSFTLPIWNVFSEILDLAAVFTSVSLIKHLNAGTSWKHLSSNSRNTIMMFWWIWK